MDILTDHHSIHISTVSSKNLLSTCLIQFNPKRPGLLGGVSFGEIMFLLSIFLGGDKNTAD